MAEKNAFNPDVGASKFHSSWHILPSKIRVDHKNNDSREAHYKVSEQLPELKAFFPNNKFCFRREQVEARLESYKRTGPRGQKQDVTVYKTSTGIPVLKSGFLRHAAMALAEVRGELGLIAGAGTDKKPMGLRCTRVDEPKTIEARLEMAWANHEENSEREDTSPVDLAWFCKRQLDGDPNMTRETLASRLGRKVDYVNRHLRLLTLDLAVQLAVHEGTKKMGDVLSKASKDGEGAATGPKGKQAGVKRSVLQNVFRAMADPEQNYKPSFTNKTKFTGHEVICLLAHITGIESDDPPPQSLIDLIENAPAKPKKTRGQRGPGKKGLVAVATSPTTELSTEGQEQIARIQKGPPKKKAGKS